MQGDLQLGDELITALEQRYKSDPTTLREYVRRARRLTYSSTIISCYGLIEQIVDSLMMALAEGYNRIFPSYEDIPEAVRSHHRELLLTCLRDGSKSRIRKTVEERTLISALALGPASQPGLVPSVFTLSTANYRWSYIQSLLARLGVDQTGGFYQGTADDALAKAGFANYESLIEDLVQRRNDLAHSYGDDDIVDRDILAAYVEVASSYMLDLIRISNLAIIKQLRDWQIEPIGVVVKTWSGRVGIRMEVGSISVGDRLLLLKDDWCTSHEVESLQSEGVSQDAFVVNSGPLNVAAKVASNPSNAEGCEAYVLPTTWDEFWPSSDKWGSDAYL